jgi:phosphate transport system substrate-binding protein
MSYSLLLDQIVYTSFTDPGLKAVASTQLPAEIQQAFMEKIVQQHWNSHPTLEVGQQAVYLHQITPDHTLFGWLYNVGTNELNDEHIPYFICYYLAEPLLFYFQLEKIFTCLHKGPVTLLERDAPNFSIESVVVRNVWDYKSVRPGLIIPILMRARSHLALKQGELLDLFVTFEQQEKIFKTHAQTHDQEIENITIYARQLVKAVETGIVSLNEDINDIKAKVSTPYLQYKRKLQQYEQAFISAIQVKQPFTEQTRNNLKRLQRDLQLRNDDIERIEAGSSNVNLPSSLNRNSKPNFILYAYKKKTFLLTASIVAAVMILLSFFDEIAQQKHYTPHVNEFNPVKTVGREE